MRSYLICYPNQFEFLDVKDIRFVINYDYPNNSEDYVHRIGRTGRSENKVKILRVHLFLTQSVREVTQPKRCVMSYAVLRSCVWHREATEASKMG